tara:strand:+ start:6893 stop:7732 length:840 start_codon:yes stop_codon:yes gene_type:complete
VRIIFTISTKEFEPISFRGNYLHDNYDNLISFLKINSEFDIVRLAKPVQKDENSFDFYAEFNNPLKRISEFNKETQDIILKSYFLYLEKMDSLAESLINSKVKDKQDWGEILKCIFNRSDNIIVTDGNDWTLIWGWSFRNKDENYIPLVSKHENSDTRNNSVFESTETLKNEIINENDFHDNDDLVEDREKQYSDTKDRSSSLRENIGLLGYFKRFFRWISFRFWGLMLLIVYTLIIICLCHYCSADSCQNDCSKLDETEKELLLIKEHLRKRCISDTI